MADSDVIRDVSITLKTFINIGARIFSQARRLRT